MIREVGLFLRPAVYRHRSEINQRGMEAANRVCSWLAGLPFDRHPLVDELQGRRGFSGRIGVASGFVVVRI